MQIFYDKIKGLSIEPTDSIQHVKDLIEVRSSTHSLQDVQPCELRLCKAHTLLVKRLSTEPICHLSILRSHNCGTGEIRAASLRSAAHLWRETTGGRADSGRGWPGGWQHYEPRPPPAWR